MLLLCPEQLLDGDHPPLSGHGVLIDGEHIRDVGPIARFEGFAGARLDLPRSTLLPGLIDCHVHLCFGAEADLVPLVRQSRPVDVVLRALAHAQMALCGGVTTVRDLGGCDYAELAVRDGIRSGRHPGPTIVCAGKMICITGGHGWFVGIEADGALECIRAVRSNVRAGVDWIKFMATGGVLTPGIDPLAAHQRVEETAALIEEARRLGRRTACHATGAEGILQAVQAGVTSVEHGFELTDEIIDGMLERGTVLVPTLSAMGTVDDDCLARLPPSVRERVPDFRELQQRSVLRFYRAGGVLAMGTDAGTPFNPHGANAQELALMVRLGITPLDAIQAATARAADLLDLADRGRIAPGRRADLLVVNGDPLRDIAAVADRANHRCVYKDGRVAAARADPDSCGPLALVTPSIHHRP